MKKVLFPILAALALAGTAKAEWVRFGQSDWYTWSEGGADDGWWYYRSWNGYKYSYHKHSKKDATIKYSENWREDLLKIVAQREKYRLAAEKSAADQKEFLDAVKALGLDTGYSSGVSYDAKAYAFRDYGNTIFSYTYNSQAGVQEDPAALAHSTTKLAEHVASASERTSKAAIAVSEKVATTSLAAREREATLAAAVAALHEANQTARALLAEKSAAHVTETTSSEIRVNASGTGLPTRDQAMVAAKGVVMARCVACHDSTKASGSLNLEDLTVLSDVQRKSVIRAIKSDNPSTRMPKGKPALPLVERYVLELALGEATKD